jgi:hypothetical protein
MAEDKGRLERIAEGLATALSQLADIAQPAHLATLLKELGVDNPPDLSGDAQLAQRLSEVAAHVTGLTPRVEELIAAAEEKGTIEIVAAGAAVLAQCTAVGVALDAVGTRLQAALANTPGGPQLAAEFAEHVIGHIMARHLDAEYPLLRRLLTLATILEWDVVAPETHGLVAVVRSRLHAERLPKLLSDPLELLESGYGWGRNDFNASHLLQRIGELFEPLDPIAAFGDEDGPPIPPVLDFGVFTLAPTATPPPGLAGELFLEVAEDNIFTLGQLSDDWKVMLSLGGRFREGLTMELLPPTKIEITPSPGSTLDGCAALEVMGQAPDPAHSILLLRITGASRMEAKSVSAGLISSFRWNAGLGRAEGDAGFEGQIRGGKLLIAMEQADGFLAKLVSRVSLEANFDVGFGWTAGGGVYFTGSSTLEVQLPTHINLGPIDITGITISIGIQDSGFPTGLSTSIKAALGPLTAIVEQVGISANLSFPPNHSGNLGLLDLAFGFKPPTGVGLAIDAGVVKGGGYLYFDPDKGEYAGAMELTVSDWLALKAIGLINTKLPGGQSGFSLLVIITAEFNPGFQLGYGFALIGVGGIVGLNRAVLLDPLVQGVKTGAVNSILFPTNVVANAPKILSDLRAVFPPEPGVFLIGPMAKIGWGTPTLISVSLGVIIEIPGDVVILGRLRAALPTDEQAVLILQVSFIGALEFSKRRIWFFATMYESRVLFITLDGDMGLLMDFSDNPNFVLSVGGFHPRFSAPPLPFPSPSRIAMSLVNRSWARVRAEAYFAITSNTVQMGCRLEAFFGFDALKVDGHFGFDALVRFSPFYLIVEISAGFSVKVFGIGLFSVRLRGSLEGPTPWHISGSAEISLLFFSIDVDVDVTFGERRAEVLPPIEVLPRIQAEFEKPESWRATLPSSGRLFVSLRELGSAEALVLHPVGTLQISQRFAPLNLPLDKIGNQKPSDVKKVTVAVQTGSLKVKGPTKEKFAVAQYRNMDDAAKLSARAYEPLESGIEVGADGQPWATGPVARRNVRYETIIVDTAFERVRLPYFQFSGRLFTHFLGGASVSRAVVSLAHEKRMQPFDSKVAVGEDLYTVALQANNRAYAAESTFSSYAEAQAHMEEAVRRDPSLSEEIHVIPAVEVNQAP